MRPAVAAGGALAALAVTGVSVALLLRRPPAASGAASPPLSQNPAAPGAQAQASEITFVDQEADVLVGEPSNAQRQIEALGRMLVSEDPRPRIQLVIGWTAVQQASRWGLSVHRLLTGKSGKYGPQQLLGEVRYAATTKPATPAALRLAEQILSGEVEPSQAIRDHGPGAWVELGVKGYTPRKILQRQVHTSGAKKGLLDFGGIWGRLEGTGWFLYSARSPVLPIPETEAEAKAVLDAVPEVPAEDRPKVA